MNVSVPIPAGLQHRIPDRLDWYTLRSLFGPLLLALMVLLLAQLLERLLRLFEMAAATGASMMVVVNIAATLVPHYLGMALPAAFFAAIFMSVARTGDDNELDAMLATGRSISRMAVPYFLVAIVLCGFNLYLFGFLQPYSRYGYHVASHNALNTGWNARMEGNRFVSVKHGFTLGADDVGADGRTLAGVFVQRRVGRSEEIITAQRGRLVPAADGSKLLLELNQGLIVSDNDDGTVRTVSFASGRINEDFTAVPPPYRARGNSVRELTLPELWQGRLPPDGEITASQRDGEMHGRLARTLLPLLLPLLALPLGMAAKRGRRAPGTVFAAVALLALNQSLQFGESLAESGRAMAQVSVWLPVVVFGVLGIWLFRSSLQWPGDNPVMRAVAAIESGFEGMQKRRRGGK
ncbi:MAG: LptF/LptG family permease [Proteobacteria bacterium]|jgi:lipopolysaccharide export system permease protein|nr:LptF/LptG family permease [Pseudomonadota bacterium]MBK9251890.1 LptF/LptG family permease [Pseudomonadota bacterium]MCC6631458.1 LptF/LptG family permease [Gammaproteobacteria bacterium]